jgi:hypothetical protein
LEQIHLSGIENVAGIIQEGVGGIFELRSKPELTGTPGASASG